MSVTTLLIFKKISINFLYFNVVVGYRIQYKSNLSCFISTYYIIFPVTWKTEDNVTKKQIPYIYNILSIWQNMEKFID